jgi:hypothetical protein
MMAIEMCRAICSLIVAHALLRAVSGFVPAPLRFARLRQSGGGVSCQ